MNEVYRKKYAGNNKIRISFRSHSLQFPEFQGFSLCPSTREYDFRERSKLGERAREEIIITDEISPNIFWYAIEPTWSCITEKRVGGVGDGGKYLCGYDFSKKQISVEQKCVIYSFGSAGQDDFERFMSTHTSCDVHIFDPTPRIRRDMTARARKYGAHFHSIGLGGLNGKINMNGIWQNNLNGAELKILSLPEIMDQFEHDRIDVLKVDIEGSEYDAFEVILLNCEFDIEIILLELHVFGPESRDQIFKLISDMERCGYRMYHKEPNYQGCHGTKCVEFAFTRSDCKSESSYEILQFNHESNLAGRKSALIKYKNSKIYHNPRLFWDFFEPDSVCKTLKKVGGFTPEGLYTCFLRENCNVILFGDFHGVYEDFLQHCKVVKLKPLRNFTLFTSGGADLRYSLIAIRFEDKEHPDLEIYRTLTGLISRSCENFPDQISVEIHWSFEAKSSAEVMGHKSIVSALFKSLENCDYSIFHKEPNLMSGRGHRYLMYSWIRFEHIVSDWEL